MEESANKHSGHSKEKKTTGKKGEEQNSYDGSSNLHSSRHDSAYGSYGSWGTLNQHLKNNSRSESNHGSGQSQLYNSSKSSLSSGFDCFKPTNYNLEPPPAIIPKSVNCFNNKPLIFGRRDKKDSDLERSKFKPLTPSKSNNGNVTNETEENRYKTSETKVLQVAALSQALGYIDEFRKTQELKKDKFGGPDQSELNDLATNLQEVSQAAAVTETPQVQTQTNITQLKDKLDKEYDEKHTKDALCAAISLHDGLVKHTTSSITEILGYPKDMWVGRSFLDFLHPQDRATFTSEVTAVITLPLLHSDSHDMKTGTNGLQTKDGQFFCRLRKYNGLKSGIFAVKERKTTYTPFKLSACFRDIDLSDHSSDQNNSEPVAFGTQQIFLFITAIPISSAYTFPFEEGPIRLGIGQSSFVTKHGPDCTYSLVSETAISFLGYLPQDLKGEDIFNYYHPQDLPILKEAFEAVFMEHGKPFKSKPYRFKVRNGSYILLTTDFSCFINPWSRKLECIIGKHTIMKGPRFPNVFAECTLTEEGDEIHSISEEILKEGKNIQNEIRHLLTETVKKGVYYDSSANNSSRRRKQLGSFMGSLLDKIANSTSNKKGGSSEDNTIVVGDISTNQEDSTETPPSYNQLNYNENLTRFFNSQPKTLTEKEATEEKSQDKDFGGILKVLVVDSPKVETKQQSSSEADYSQNTTTNEEKSPVSNEQTAEESSKSKKGTDREQSKTEMEKDKEDDKRSDSGYGKHRHKAVSGSGAGNSSSIQAGMSTGQIQQGREDGLLSQDGTGSGTGSQTGTGSAEGNTDGYKPPLLTLENLEVHNKGMEMKMIEKYRGTKKSGELRFQKPTRLSGARRYSSHKRQANNCKRLKHPPKVERILDNKGKKENAHFNRNNQASQQFTTGLNLPQKTDEEGREHKHFSKNDSGQSFTSFAQSTSKSAFRSALPGQITSFGNLITVPTFYIPPGTSLPTNNQLFECQPQSDIRLQTAPTYISSLPRLNPTYPTWEDREHVKDKQSTQHTKTSSKAQLIPELPNSAAVNSCILEPQSGVQSDKSIGILISKDDKFVISSPRPASTAATSLKAELGSASASAKDRHETTRVHVVNNSSKPNDWSEGSSSLYSLLKSSDDNITDSEQTTPSKANIVSGQAKPVLSEPFWNENVMVDHQLLFNYQLEPKKMENVLEDDLKHIKVMNQPTILNDQLINLYSEIDKNGEEAQSLLEEEPVETDSDSEVSDEGSSDNSKTKTDKRKKLYERLNMFHEAEAPFPSSESAHDSERDSPPEEKSWSNLESGTSSFNSDSNSNKPSDSNSNKPSDSNSNKPSDKAVQQTTDGSEK